MQLDWNELRLLDALRKTGSFGGAAGLLGVDPTTVARRVRAAEDALGTALVERDARGRAVLTERAAKLADIGAGVAASLAGEPMPARVRVSAPPFLVTQVLAPAASNLSDVAVDLLSDAGNVNLTRRSADMALRLARPEAGGHRVLTRKIGRIEYVAVAVAGAEGQPWIGYDEAMGHLPHAAWIDAAGPVGLRVTDLDAAMAAARAGAGPTLAPKGWVRPPLVPLDGEVAVSRDIWLLTFRDIAHQAAVKVVAAWAEGAVASAF